MTILFTGMKWQLNESTMNNAVIHDRSIVDSCEFKFRLELSCRTISRLLPPPPPPENVLSGKRDAIVNAQSSLEIHFLLVN